MATSAALTFVAPAGAATFNVDSTADEPDADTSVAACATTGGDCTLRAAVDQANATTEDSTINLPLGTYTLAGTAAEDANEGGDLDVDATGFKVTFSGAGARTTIIDGDGVDRVLHVLPDTEVLVRGLTITGGDTDITDSEEFPSTSAVSDGGGIFLDDSGEGPTELEVTDSTIRGNRAGNEFELPEELGGGPFAIGDGGGIHASEGSELTVTRTTISGNSAADDGGGIETDAATTTVTNSTIHDNSARGGFDGDGDGGGIEQNEGVLSVVHSTIANNTAPDKGGGINLEPEMFFNPIEIICEITGICGEPFTAEESQGPGQVESRQVEEVIPPEATIRSTILAANQGPGEGPNCRVEDTATLTSAGTNLESGTDCGFSAAGNLQSIDPQLGPLANNGGPTDTRALGPTSPALHKATTAPCPATDQRAITRPQGPACDIGAFERVLMADLSVTITDTPDPVDLNGTITYKITVSNAGPDAATNSKGVNDLPGGVTLGGSSIGGGGACTGATSLTCALSTLPVGATREVTVTGRAIEEGTKTDTVRVSATEADPAPANNEASTSTTVNPAATEEGTGDGTGGGSEDTTDAAGTEATSDSGDDLPFTGLQIVLLALLGVLMLGAGTGLRRLTRRRRAAGQ